VGTAIGHGGEAAQELVAELRGLHLKGVVELVQKRKGATFQYLAVKRRAVASQFNPWPPQSGVPEARLYANPRQKV